MKTEKLEIILKAANGSDVHLQDMSVEALESFLSVTHSLKNIVSSISPEITFAIKEGSACTAVNASPRTLSNIYGEIGKAIDGESDDDIITANMREIQTQIQTETYNYQFFLSKHNIAKKIKEAKKIVKKRKSYTYRSEVRVLTGKCNNVGGNVPNYHFEHGDKVECSITDAMDMTKYLYKTINCLVLKKFEVNGLNDPTYSHLEVLNANQFGHFIEFTKNLSKENDLLKRLSLIYWFANNSNSLIDDMRILLKLNTIIFEDPNELKTLLILTKGFKEDSRIGDLRKIVLEIFESKMNSL